MFLQGKSGQITIETWLLLNSFDNTDMNVSWVLNGMQIVNTPRKLEKTTTEEISTKLFYGSHVPNIISAQYPLWHILNIRNMQVFFSHFIEVGSTQKMVSLRISVMIKLAFDNKIFALISKALWTTIHRRSMMKWLMQLLIEL